MGAILSELAAVDGVRVPTATIKEMNDEMRTNQNSDIFVIKELLSESRPYWLHLGTIFFLEFLSTPLSLLAPIPLMLAVDSVIGSKPLPEFLRIITPDSIEASKTVLLLSLSVLLVIVALLSNLIVTFKSLLKTFTSEMLVLQFRARLLNHAQRVSLAYHDKIGTADSIYRIQHDAPAISSIVVNGITPFISAGSMLIGMIVVTAKIDLQLALVALVVSPVIAYLTYLVRKELREQWHTVKRLESSALRMIKETLGSLRVVKAFGQEHLEHGRFISQANKGYGARMQAVKRESLHGFFVGTTLAVGTAVVLFLGVTHVESGVITLGKLFLVMSYLGQLYNPLQSLGMQVATLQHNLASAERAFVLLTLPPEVVDRPDPLPLQSATGEVEFRNVSFSYEPHRAVLHDISFLVPEGSRVGIAGKTGSGKTTLMNLLIRFYDPDSGEILLDGMNIKDHKVSDLRNQIAVVLQEPILFSGTVTENIAYGRPTASLKEIEAAASMANVDEFIMTLPEGYNTKLGERGMLLSGGQRQRIALARAFLKDAPILILDEPTSSVDVKTEAIIMDAMERLMQGRTTFVIAHRLSTLDHCDMILLLDQGRLLKATSKPRGEAIAVP